MLPATDRAGSRYPQLPAAATVAPGWYEDLGLWHGLGRPREPAARGGTAHLHVEFSQLPLKQLWVRCEGHGANICRRERGAQVGVDPRCVAVIQCATRGE